MSLPLLFTCLAAAGTVNYTGPGGNLNVATFDSSNNPVEGTTTYIIPVTDLYVIDVGDAVTVSLTGLLYPYAGDLQATLSLEDTLGNVILSGDIFNQIGAYNPGDPGYATQFGRPDSSVDSGNYTFNSSFQTSCPTGPGACDLWNTASMLGSTDSIPDGDYFTTTALSPANDNLSSMFAGLPVTGKWVLTINDYYPPDPSTPYVPGLTSWGVSINVVNPVVPEPSTMIPIALCAGFLALGIRRHSQM